MQVAGQDIRSRINDGDEVAIVAGLSRLYPPMEAVYALKAACRFGYKTEEVKRAIESLYDYDFDVFCGIRLVDFLDAANDVLGFSMYNGDSRAVKNLIATRLN